MPMKMALVDFPKCQPERCGGITCAAAEACPHKLLKQEHPDEVPMTTSASCRGCADCVRACPLNAMRIINQ